MSLDPLERLAAPLLSIARKTARRRNSAARATPNRWPLMAVGLLGCGVLKSGLRPGIVVGDSMLPTLRSGQWFVLDSRAYQGAPPRRGDVVVFRHQGTTYIKRVLGVGGDRVLMLEVLDADGVWRTPIEPAFMERTQRLCRRDPRWRLVEHRVPAGHLYMMGDMVTRSLDSRHLGPIPVREVRGQVRVLGPRFYPVSPAPPRAVMPPPRPLAQPRSRAK
jgi:signal peptidase I